MTKQSGHTADGRPKPWIDNDRLLGAYERFALMLARRLAEDGRENEVEAAMAKVIDPASVRIGSGYPRWRLVEFCDSIRVVLLAVTGRRDGSGAGGPRPEKAAKH